MAGPDGGESKGGSFRIALARGVIEFFPNPRVLSPRGATGNIQTSVTSFPMATLIPTLEGLALASVLSWA